MVFEFLFKEKLMYQLQDLIHGTIVYRFQSRVYYQHLGNLFVFCRETCHTSVLVCYPVIAPHSKSIRFGIANLFVPSKTFRSKSSLFNPPTQTLCEEELCLN